MKTPLKESLIMLAVEQAPLLALPARERTLRYVGSVARATNERVLAAIGKLLDRAPEEEIALMVTSPGGATGTAMNFYDSIRHVLKPRLVSIASGEVDSSGLIIFLSGEKRYATARTTALLHSAGRYFGTQRYTAAEMAAMLAEDQLKDQQYAQVVADNSQGRLTREAVLQMMSAQTVLAPEDLMRYGLIHAILP